MTEMTPQAPGASAGTADEQALAALRYGWGDAYMIGCDDEHGWWAARRDQVGGYLTAHDPDSLRAAIQLDCDLKPVPGDCPAPAAGEP